MKLVSPVTIQPPQFVNSKGQQRQWEPMTIKELDITTIDNAKRKLCTASIRPCPRPITLWSGAEYDAAGDYTQAQVEARVLEVLGPDLRAGLEGLFQVPTR